MEVNSPSVAGGCQATTQTLPGCEEFTSEVKNQVLDQVDKRLNSSCPKVNSFMKCDKLCRHNDKQAFEQGRRLSARYLKRITLSGT